MRGRTCPPDCECGRHWTGPRHAYDAEFRAKISAAFKGGHHETSPETRAKISAALAGREVSSEVRDRLLANARALTKHGYAGSGGSQRSPEYRAWENMKYRCLNPRAQNYAGYGGRGITIDPRWLVFENFLSDMGEKPEPKRLYSLEREDNDGGYGPGLCVWADKSTQQRNKRSWKCEPGCTCGKHSRRAG